MARSGATTGTSVGEPVSGEVGVNSLLVCWRDGRTYQDLYSNTRITGRLSNGKVHVDGSRSIIPVKIVPKPHGWDYLHGFVGEDFTYA